MRRATFIMSTLAIVVGATTLQAQAAQADAKAKPNFAGKWTLADAGAATGSMMAGMGMEGTIVQDEKTLTVIRSYEGAGEVKSVYNLDGSQTNNSVSYNGGTIDRVGQTAWDGNKLVITDYVTIQGNALEVKMVLSLDDAGALVVEAALPTQNGLETTKLTYKKG